MLSPNAMNLVAVERRRPHDVGRKRAGRTSAAARRGRVQVTLFVPTGRLVPLAGVHDVVTGAAPPVTVGAGR